MPSYDLYYVGNTGVLISGTDEPRIILASVGGALLKYLIESPETPPNAITPLASGFRITIVDQYGAHMPDGYGTAGVDWTAYSGIDTDLLYPAFLASSDFTAADPCPSLTSWAIELGGTVSGTQVHP